MGIGFYWGGYQNWHPELYILGDISCGVLLGLVKWDELACGVLPGGRTGKDENGYGIMSVAGT